jgi:hypothetical protein
MRIGLSEDRFTWSGTWLSQIIPPVTGFRADAPLKNPKGR